MRVPVKSTQNSQSQNPRPVSSSNNIINNSNNNVNIAGNIGFGSHSNNSSNTTCCEPTSVLDLRRSIAGNIGFGSHSNSSNTTCYEPTSVLDLRRSPSPVPQKPAVAAEAPATTDPSVEWEEEERMIRNMDWDFITDLGGLDDDYSVSHIKSNPQLTRCPPQIQQQFTESTPFQQLDSTQLLPSDFSFIVPDLYSNQNQSSSSFPDFSNNLLNTNGNLNVGYDFIEEIIRAADCFDSNELQLAQMILARLNQRLRSPVGKPIQRAAFFFKEALNSLLNGFTRPTCLSSQPEIIQSIRAYKAFSGFSPIPMFAHFTSNQALLESLDGSPSLIHIIDFDIGFGGQYASFMREIAEKGQSCNKFMNPTSLRITAVVSEEYVAETRLIKENLIHFAEELRIRFHIEFVLVRTFEMFSFKSVKFMDGEKIAVVLSPTIFRRLASTNNAVVLVTDMRRLSPSVIIFVDDEGWTETGTSPLFRRNFVNSLEYYTLVFESLDAASIGGGDCVREIESFFMRPKITAAVEVAGRLVAPWREVFSGAELRPVQLSQFADFQAECLLAKVQVSGFHVAKRQAELVLCWQQRALVATSAWRF